MTSKHRSRVSAGLDGIAQVGIRKVLEGERPEGGKVVQLAA